MCRKRGNPYPAGLGIVPGDEKRNMNGTPELISNRFPLLVKKVAKVDVSRDDKTGTDNPIVKPVSGKGEANRVPARPRDRKRS